MKALACCLLACHELFLLRITLGKPPCFGAGDYGLNLCEL